ncbi:hypothetical protein BaRGS_00022753 [Batillaria attramentaria]|uniref:L1 transposable element RRM domain-containing protein n=1 Tax=Batillaria attramentaria TaxID=370345 RepID=A0ABD0KG35_9CAEN
MSSQRAGSTKRNRDPIESTDSSQDFTTTQPSGATHQKKKVELLKRARKKKARKAQEAESSGHVSIKTLFATISKSDGKSTSSMAASEDDPSTSLTQEPVSTISHADIMNKLCYICDQLKSVNTKVDELRGEVFDLKQENDKLKAELKKCQNQQEKADEVVKEAKFLASVAERRANDLEQYTRRNNVRVLGVPESDRESGEECESKVLKLFQDKLGLTRMGASDIEACHRIGKRERQQGQNQRQNNPRPIIVRFISRKAAEAVLANRRKMKGSGRAIVEDLTKDNFVLLTTAWDHPGVEDAWTWRGNIFAKPAADNASIRRISRVGDLQLIPIPEITTSTPNNRKQRRQRPNNAVDRTTIDQSYQVT